jgi:hypothetical protein
MTAHSKYYINLPNQSFSYLKPNVNIEYLHDIQVHNWVELETTDYITDEAIRWLITMGFDIKTKIYLFCANHNIIGPIHSDLSNYAFNFVVSGYGTMEWVKPYNKPYTDEKVYSNRVSKYLRYVSHENDVLLDIWNGTQGMVQVFTPHRIVTHNEKRYTLSLRTHCKHIQSWDQAVQKLLSHMPD